MNAEIKKLYYHEIDHAHLDFDADPVYQENMERVLAELGENDRLALTLYYLNDLPIKDIAEMLQISEGAVKQRLSHGRKKFKEAYEERETGKVVARHAKK